jgi:hypothetical protein
VTAQPPATVNRTLLSKPLPEAVARPLRTLAGLVLAPAIVVVLAIALGLLEWSILGPLNMVLGVVYLPMLFIGLPAYVVLLRRGLHRWRHFGLAGLLGGALFGLLFSLLVVLTRNPSNTAPRPSRFSAEGLVMDGLVIGALTLVAALFGLATAIVFRLFVRRNISPSAHR